MSSSLSIVITSGLDDVALNAEKRFVDTDSTGVEGGCCTGLGGIGCCTGLGGEGFRCIEGVVTEVCPNDFVVVVVVVVTGNEDPVANGLAADVVTGNELPCPIPPADTPVFPPTLPAPNVNGFVISDPNTGFTILSVPVPNTTFSLSVCCPPRPVDPPNCTNEYPVPPCSNPAFVPSSPHLSSSLLAVAVAGESRTSKIVSAVLLGVPPDAKLEVPKLWDVRNERVRSVD